VTGYRDKVKGTGIKNISPAPIFLVAKKKSESGYGKRKDTSLAIKTSGTIRAKACLSLH
jgi:hypothetical protein